MDPAVLRCQQRTRGGTVDSSEGRSKTMQWTLSVIGLRCIESCRAALARAASAFTKDIGGKAALHLAASYGRSKVVGYCIVQGSPAIGVRNIGQARAPRQQSSTRRYRRDAAGHQTSR